MICATLRATLDAMTARKRSSADLTGIRQRGRTYQVRVFGGTDPVIGKQLVLTGSAETQAAAIVLRDGHRKQVRERTAVRAGVTLGYLLDEWLLTNVKGLSVVRSGATGVGGPEYAGR